MSSKGGLTEASKYLAFVLRHKPQAVGIALDEHGWANVDELVAAIAAKREFSKEMLDEIVVTDSKGRYSYSEDGSRIRANQGHSINVDVELKAMEPLDILYHGTATKYLASIQKSGLVSKSRLYVHLSADVETANKVGRRHGDPVVLAVDSKRMASAGYAFFLSENGVWLTKVVPVQYLRVL